MAARSLDRGEALSAAASRFADGDCQSIGVDILGDPSAEDVLRLLDAGHVLLAHSPVEFVEIRNAESGTAASGGAWWLV